MTQHTLATLSLLCSNLNVLSVLDCTDIILGFAECEVCMVWYGNHPRSSAMVKQDMTELCRAYVCVQRNNGASVTAGLIIVLAYESFWRLFVNDVTFQFSIMISFCDYVVTYYSECLFLPFLLACYMYADKNRNKQSLWLIYNPIVLRLFQRNFLFQ